MAMNTAEKVFHVREQVKDFFHAASAENVVFTPGCTHSINWIIKGLLHSGDHVVLSCLEHNAVWRPIQAMQKLGVSYTVAKVFPGDDNRTVESFVSCIKPNTKLVVCTHASNVWGIRLPIARLVAEAHRHHALFLLDAAQTAGVIPIDLKKMSVDYLCCAGHKGLYAPMGVGLLIFAPGSELELAPSVEGGTGSASTSPWQPLYLPDKFESGTGNVPGILGLGAGIDFINQKGQMTIFRHEMQLTQYLYQKLKMLPHTILYTEEPNSEHFAPVLSFNVKGLPSEQMAERLNRVGIAVRAGLHCAPLAHHWAQTLQTGAVRCVPSAFTTKEQINALIHQISLMKNGNS